MSRASRSAALALAAPQVVGEEGLGERKAGLELAHAVLPFTSGPM